MSKIIRDDIKISSFIDDWELQQAVEKYAQVKIPGKAIDAPSAPKKKDVSAPGKKPSATKPPSAAGKSNVDELRKAQETQAYVRASEKFLKDGAIFADVLRKAKDVQKSIAELIIELPAFKKRISQIMRGHATYLRGLLVKHQEAVDALVKSMQEQIAVLKESLGTKVSEISTNLENLNGQFVKLISDSSDNAQEIALNRQALSNALEKIETIERQYADLAKKIEAAAEAPSDAAIIKLERFAKDFETKLGANSKEVVELKSEIKKLKAIKASPKVQMPPPSASRVQPEEPVSGAKIFGDDGEIKAPNKSEKKAPKQEEIPAGTKKPESKPEVDKGSQQLTEDFDGDLPSDIGNYEKVNAANIKARKFSRSEPLSEELIDEYIDAYADIFNRDPDLIARFKAAARTDKYEASKFIDREVRAKTHRSRTIQEKTKSKVKEYISDNLAKQQYRWWWITGEGSTGRKILFGTLIAGSIYYIWTLKNDINRLRTAIALIGEASILASKASDFGNLFISSLSSLKFEPGSKGESETSKVIKTVSKLISDTDTLKIILDKIDAQDQITDSERSFISDYLDNIGDNIILINNWINNSSKYQQDLSDQNSEDIEKTKTLGKDFISSIDKLLLKMNEILKTFGAERVSEVMYQRNEDVPLEDPSVASRLSEEGRDREYPEIPIDIWGLTLDIGNKNEQWRNAFIQIANTLLKTPAGKAFIDPNNKWGGGMEVGKSGDIKTDILQGASELIKNRVYTRPALRRYMRRKHPKGSRRMASGWRAAIRYYRKNPVKIALNFVNRADKIIKLSKYTKNRKNLHKNLEKSNKSIIFSEQGMKKQAEYNSTEFFETALRGVKDTYTRSYWSGLKGMHQEKPEKSEADYKKLYKLHNETGSGLVQDAHPTSLDIADSMGRGGRVENIVEQHNHNEDVALSMPSANFRGRHANLTEAILKIAGQAEEDGSIEASKILKNLANKI